MAKNQDSSSRVTLPPGLSDYNYQLMGSVMQELNRPYVDYPYQRTVNIKQDPAWQQMLANIQPTAEEQNYRNLTLTQANQNITDYNNRMNAMYSDYFDPARSAMNQSLQVQNAALKNLNQATPLFKRSENVLDRAVAQTPKINQNINQGVKYTERVTKDLNLVQGAGTKAMGTFTKAANTADSSLGYFGQASSAAGAALGYASQAAGMAQGAYGTAAMGASVGQQAAATAAQGAAQAAGAYSTAASSLPYFAEAKGVANQGLGYYRDSIPYITKADKTFDTASKTFGEAAGYYKKSEGDIDSGRALYQASLEDIARARELNEQSVPQLGLSAEAVGQGMDVSEQAQRLYELTAQGQLAGNLNPYQAAVVEEMARLADKNYKDVLMKDINASFVGGGGFGGTRNAAVLAQTAREVQQDVSGKQAELMKQGWDAQMANQLASATGLLNTGQNYYAGAAGYRDTATGYQNAATTALGTAGATQAAGQGYYDAATGLQNIGSGLVNTGQGYVSAGQGYLGASEQMQGVGEGYMLGSNAITNAGMGVVGAANAQANASSATAANANAQANASSSIASNAGVQVGAANAVNNSGEVAIGASNAYTNAGMGVVSASNALTNAGMGKLGVGQLYNDMANTRLNQAGSMYAAADRRMGLQDNLMNAATGYGALGGLYMTQANQRSNIGQAIASTGGMYADMGQTLGGLYGQQAQLPTAVMTGALDAYQQARLNDASAQYQTALTQAASDQANLDWNYQRFMDSTYQNRANQQYVFPYLSTIDSMFSGTDANQSKPGSLNVGSWF